MNKFVLTIITVLHLMFIMFVVITPFTNSNYLLLLHAIIIPFIILHWLCNNNTCCLTMVERSIRKKIYGSSQDDHCITCKLVEPVYDFKNNYNGFSNLIYILTISLWAVSAGKLFYRYKTGSIQKLDQLFKI